MIIVNITDAGKQRQIQKSIVEDRHVGAQCKMRKMLLMWTLTGSTVRNGVCWDTSFHVLFTAFVRNLSFKPDVVFVNVVFC